MFRFCISDAPVRKALNDVGNLDLIDEPHFIAILKELHAAPPARDAGATGAPSSDEAAPSSHAWH